MKPTNPRSSTTANLRSALIAGIVAFAIYLVITILIGGFSVGALPTSLLIGGATFVVASLVMTIIVAVIRRRQG